MTVFIQDVETGLFMDAVSSWQPKEEAYDFRTPAFAVDLCIMRGLREVRIIVNWGDPEQSISLDLHTGSRDASVGKGLRKSLCEDRKLREGERPLRRELDAARAEAKKRKKQIPFVPKEGQRRPEN